MRFTGIFLIVLLLLVDSCSVPEYTTGELLGWYSVPRRFKSEYSIALKSDSTYLFDVLDFRTTGKMTGKWYIDGRYIVLNSDYSPSKGGTSYIFESVYNGESDKLGITVLDTGLNPVRFAPYQIEDEFGEVKGGIASVSGKAEMDWDKTGYLIIKAPGYDLFKCPVPKDKNEIIIILADKHLAVFVMENYRVKIKSKGQSLLFKNRGTGMYKDYEILEKQM